MTYKTPSSSIKNRFDQNWLRTVHVFVFGNLKPKPPSKKKEVSLPRLGVEKSPGDIDNAINASNVVSTETDNHPLVGGFLTPSKKIFSQVRS